MMRSRYPEYSSSLQKTPILSRPAVRKWMLLTLVVAVIGLLNFGMSMITALSIPIKITWKIPFVRELSYACGILILMPAMLWLMARFPIERGKLARRISFHALASILFAFALTLFMWIVHVLLSTVTSWGWDSYAFLGYRFFAEIVFQVFVYWSVYFVFATFQYSRISREQELATSRLERELVAARLAALKMQLNPHFLFNTLNMISSDIEHAPKRADMTLHHLSDFLRITLRSAPVQEVALEKEIEFLNSYLEIMKARFEDRLLVDVAIPEATRNILVPHLILQPLVENSITQCMADFSRQGCIRIASSLTDSRLRIVIEDNGPGLSGVNDSAPTQGIGLSNTAERLRHLYGNAQRLDLSNRPEGGLCLTIEIPGRSAGAESERNESTRADCR